MLALHVRLLAALPTIIRAADMVCEVTGPCSSEGPHHKLHLRVDGSVYGVGRNNFGQLADGSLEHATDPALAQTGTPCRQISAGGWHSLFLRRDGTALSAGRNNDGQLGDGTFLTSSFPKRVLTDVQAVSAGFGHSLFLQNDGTAWSAGLNDRGQLGDGSYANRKSPVRVLTQVAGISAGHSHSLFLRTDGTVWAAGSNDWGQLGDESTLQKTRPSQVALDGVSSVSAGGHKSIFVRSDGTVWSSGQSDDPLGRHPGASWPRATPMLIANTTEEAGADGVLKLGATVYGTDLRFPVQPNYQPGLPELPGLGYREAVMHPLAGLGPQPTGVL